MATPRSKTGLLHHEDGRIEPARFYYGAHESAPPPLTQINDQYTLWREDDGAIGIRHGTAVSVGASAVYSAHYDSLDWGN